MSTITTLLDAIRPHDGRPAHALDTLSRPLREYSLLPARWSREAQKLTFRDAAMFLIGMNCTAGLVDLVTVAEIFRDLPLHAVEIKPPMTAEMSLHVTRIEPSAPVEIPDDVKAAAAAGSFVAALGRVLEIPDLGEWITASVDFAQGHRWAEIRLTWAMRSYAVPPTATLRFDDPSDRRRAPFEREHIVRVGERELVAVAKAMKSGIAD